MITRCFQNVWLCRAVLAACIDINFSVLIKGGVLSLGYIFLSFLQFARIREVFVEAGNCLHTSKSII